MEDGNSQGLQFFGCDTKVSAISPSAQGNDMRMFKEKEEVG
jgi:hypothetical protein